MSIKTFSYTRLDLRAVPPRQQDSNKSTFGRVLCVCGSVGMAGAAYLCAKAALRTGAGLVEIFTPEENRIPLQALLPEAIVSTYDAQAPDLDALDASISRAQIIVCGCGLGVSPASRSVLSHILRNSKLPTVLDADALNLLSINPSLLKYARGAIITPHPGEMSRLCGFDTQQINAQREQICRDFAAKHSLVCALKGHRTCVSDGQRVYLNKSGNSGMATAGSGDVLAGIIGGLLAQNEGRTLDMLTVASLGVYIHGLCGDAAASRLGEYSVIASDIIDALPSILGSIERK